MTKTKWFLLSVGLCVTCTVWVLAASPEGSIEIKVANTTRSYLIHLPAHYDASKTYPLVLAFHGGGGNGRQFMNGTRWNKKSDESNFIVVYPNGTGRFARMLTWNVQTCCGYAQRKKIDDVTFISKLLDNLSEQYPIDPKRVYATGMSNGGMFSYRLACELSDRITAIASVAGTLSTDIAQDARPVPILHIHGTADQNLQFNGGYGKNSIAKVNFKSVPYSINKWVKHNGCNLKPTVTNLPDTADDGMTSTRTVYANDKVPAPVELITVKNGGHSWPGRSYRRNRLGKTTLDFYAEDVIWEFFSRYKLPD